MAQKSEKQAESDQAKPIKIFESIEKIWIILLLLGVTVGTYAGVALIQANYFPLPEQLLAKAETWPIVNQDNFQGNKIWLATDGSTADNVELIFDGRLHVLVKPVPDGTREGFFSEDAFAPRRFLLSTETVIPEACHAGLIFRGNLQGEYYLFMADAHQFTVEILPRNSGGDLPREAILPNTPLPKDVGQPTNLSVVADGKTYSFYINHIFVGRMNDTRLTGERTGLEVMVCQGYSQTADFSFDNFTLRVPQP